VAFRRGFKAEAERLALDVREELGVGAYARLDPMVLAEHLAIPVMTLSELAAVGVVPDLGVAVDVLHGAESQAMSAVTVFFGSERAIVHNDAHSPGRRASNVTHELAHGLLLHPSAPVLDRRGCRNWNPDVEDEANYLAGALLIPSKAAWGLAKRRKSFDQAAVDYGCSIEMVRWRVNVTGAGRLLAG
jgi:Zn-dependent peptidase ImmA (M78 family)